MKKVGVSVVIGVDLFSYCCEIVEKYGVDVIFDLIMIDVGLEVKCFIGKFGVDLIIEMSGNVVVF